MKIFIEFLIAAILITSLIMLMTWAYNTMTSVNKKKSSNKKNKKG